MDQEPGGAAQSSEVSGPLHAQKNFQINWNHGSEGFRGAAGFSCGGAWHAAGFGDLKPNVWYHLAATYDGENLKAYRDGVLVQDNAAPSGDSDQEKLTLKLGRHGLAEWFFAGAVDEVCVFACALEADEVKALYDGKEPTTIVARPEASAPTPVVAAEPNARVQPMPAEPMAAETTPQGGKNGIAVVAIIAMVGVIAGASFFMKHKSS